METEQQLQLMEWSKETVEFYLAEVEKLGENNATSFYNQSDLSRVRDCDIMIIGINPGMGCPYLKWKVKNDISQNFLYYGNPCFRGKSNHDIIYELSEKYDPDKRRKGWDLWHKVHKMLCYSDKGDILKQLDRFVITNMIFFGTDNEKDILKEIDRIKCAKQTLKLIEILKPKVVVLLGKECRRLFKIVTKCAQMESITSDNTVFYCCYNDCHIISVYHTAYYKYYSKEINKERIGKIIGSLLDNPFNVKHDSERTFLY